MSTIMTTVTRRGQVTIPKPYRAALRLEEGDTVEWDLTAGQLVLRRIGSIADATHAVISPRKSPEDFGELREHYESYRAERAGRVLDDSALAEDDR